MKGWRVFFGGGANAEKSADGRREKSSSVGVTSELREPAGVKNNHYILLCFSLFV